MVEFETKNRMFWRSAGALSLTFFHSLAGNSNFKPVRTDEPDRLSLRRIT